MKDRFEKDNTNSHIFIAARNENGRQAINDVLSEANITGFYRQPRLDRELILSLPPKDVIVTSACIAFWKYNDIEDFVRELKRHFIGSFFLEVQYHNTESQRELNQRILNLHDQYKIPLIMGCDSHYIYSNGDQLRTDFLTSKGMDYPDEEGWYLDYPDGDEAYRRFSDQCVLSHQQICDAMDNTNVFLEVEEYDNPCFTTDIKMPSLHPDKTQEEKDKIYKKLVWQGWDAYKDNVPVDKYEHYKSEIQKEIDVVEQTKMADYFIDNYHIIRRGKENGGWLTKSGRGCFTKEAMVPTTTTYKSIADVEIGDYVFDMNGNPQKVTNTMKYHINEPLVQITYLHGSKTFSPLICTPDHKILTLRNGSKQWITAGNLTNNDYVCVPRIHFEDKGKSLIDLNDYNTFGYQYDDEFIYEYNSYRLGAYKFSPTECANAIGCGKSLIENVANRKCGVNQRNKKIIERLLEYTGFTTIEDYADYIQKRRTTKIRRFIPNDKITNLWIGMLYGDGWSSAEKTNVGLAVSDLNHKNQFNRNIFARMAERFGLPIYENKSKKRHLSQLVICSNIVSNFVQSEFFVSKKGYKKSFNPKLFEQCAENQQALLDGLFVTDGSACRAPRLSFDNTSLSVVNAYRLLTMATSPHPTSIQKRNAHTDPRGYHSSTGYKVNTFTNAHATMAPCYRATHDDNYTYLRVQKVVQLPKQECDVYDLTVENSHSYLVDNIVVHNSAISYTTNMLLGFTEVDRIAASVKMYPERFMSAERILQAGSIPDIDFNVYPVEPFAKAQQEILGEDHAYPMIAYGTMQQSAAWKLYAKSQDIPFTIASEVSNQLKKYEKAVKYAAEDEKDEIDPLDYIDRQYHEIYKRSKDYRGVITSWSIAPCAYLLYQGSIRKEIGLVRIKDNLCCLMDGKWAEKYHFLKNDLLKVSVVGLIYEAFQKLGQEPPSVPELLKLCPPDDEAWQMYEKGCTLGVNQYEKPATKARAMKYKPKNISESCAFVAAIRPGFKSMYKQFESRKPFSYGVKAFDDLIQTEEMPNSFVLYQEMEMAALNYAGIPMTDCYTAIKNIAKKRTEKVLAYKERFVKGFTEAIQHEGKSLDESEDLAHKLWQIVEDSASYSFNASHSYCVALDSLYCAWLKAHHPLEFYETYLQLMESKGDKDKMSEARSEAESYFKIKFPPFRFGQDNRKITAVPETNTINNSIASIKGFGTSVGQALYEVGQWEYNSFMEVIQALDRVGIKSAKVEPLIKIDYFQQFGNCRELLAINEMFNKFKQGTMKQIAKSKLENDPSLEEIIKRHGTDKTKSGVGKSYQITDMDGLLQECESFIMSQQIPDLGYKVKMENQQELLGYIDITTGKEEDRKKLLITDVRPLKSKDDVWGYAVFTRSIGSGKQARLTVRSSVFKEDPMQKMDIVWAESVAKNKSGYWYLQDYKKIV